MAPKKMYDKVVLKADALDVKFSNEISVGFSTFKVINSGWVVSVPRFETVEGEAGLREAILGAVETTNFFMGWVDDGKIYWEVVLVFDLEEMAVFAAKKMGQKMIYQIETGTVKWLF